MRYTLHLSTLIAMSLIGASAPASAQGAGAPQNPAAAGITLAPGGPSTTTTGMGAGATGGNINPTHNVPGVPDTSTRCRFGTDAAPSGLPGDDPAHPGFPARIGH